MSSPGWELALKSFQLRTALPAFAVTLVLWHYVTSRIKSHVRKQITSEAEGARGTHEPIPGCRSSDRPEASWTGIHQCYQGTLQVRLHD